MILFSLFFIFAYMVEFVIKLNAQLPYSHVGNEVYNSIAFISRTLIPGP